MAKESKEEIEETEKAAADEKAAGIAEPKGETGAEEPEDAAQTQESDETSPQDPKEGEIADGPDWKGMYARTLADFENFRKRVDRDREELYKGAAGEVIKDLLPIVDNLALALAQAKDSNDPFVKGVQLVYDGFIKALGAHGAVPIDAKGEPFDANFHEALAQLPGNGVAEGVVMDEVKRGWLLNGKLLRAAQVVVSAG